MLEHPDGIALDINQRMPGSICDPRDGFRTARDEVPVVDAMVPQKSLHAATGMRH